MDIVDWLPEFQVSAETDLDLQRYFFRTPAIQKILETPAWLVLGRKGTGKTAIYEYLRSANPEVIDGYHTIPLNFRDYPWPAHKLYKEGLAGELSAYQKSWRYLFFVKLLSRLIEIKRENNESLSSELKWAAKYIDVIYGNPDPTLGELIMSKLARLTKLKGPGVDLDDISLDVGSVTFEEVAGSKDLQNHLRSNAFKLLAHFEAIFKQNVGEYRFLVILDQLDENWLAGETEEYSKVLINLVNVCRNVSLEFGSTKSVKVVPFLRSDIYQSLRFNDKNKLLQDSAVVIKWNNESLDEMFFQRVMKYKPEGLELNLDKKTGAIFEVSFARQGTPPFKYITRRSFFRPRDVIVYINKMRAIHKPNDSGLFSTAELYEADKEASTSIYNELIDEWSNQIPEIERLLNVLQTIRIESFEYDFFQEKFSLEFDGHPDGRSREKLQFLFDNSIVGQKKQGRWEYVCSVPNLKMNIEHSFRTHPALKYRLHLIERRASQTD